VPPYSDVYVLSPSRSASVAERFLDTFALRREQSAEAYEFPEYSERPLVIVTSAREAIQYCEDHPCEGHRLSFRNLGKGPAHAMLFFTSDNGLILGLSVAEFEDDWFDRLKKFTGSSVGFIAFEAPPPATAAEFRELAASVA
jgi:hypothetical protein